MTTALDNELADIALEVLNEFGQTLTYKVITEGTFNVETSKSENNTSDSYNIKGYVEDLNGYSIANGLGSETSKKISIARKSFKNAPQTGAFLSFGGRTYVITRIKEHFSGDDVALYEIYCDRQS